ncbi:hypothetical protein DFH11DRAFT_252122 [Phellopilus nigrolimitatus]|nr:hypothetical protein DFH11DRAFT_252122 [Phellopilus nigrolimitatus]
MPSGAAQPPYLPFGPPHYTEPNFILPPRPRGPTSTILDGWNNELPRSQAPGSGRPRHENFDLAGSAVTPFPRQANCLIYPTIRHELDTTAFENHLPLLSSPHYGTPFYQPMGAMPPNGGRERTVYPRMDTSAQFQAPGPRAYPFGTSAHDLPTTQTSDLLFAINQLRPSFASPSHPASIPNHPRSSDDSSLDFEISPPPRPYEPDSATFGMRESVSRWTSHASGRPQHENFGIFSNAIESPSPIKQQPQKSQNATNRNPCNLCKRWHVRCVVVADELDPLCEQCRKKGVKCEFAKK